MQLELAVVGLNIPTFYEMNAAGVVVRETQEICNKTNEPSVSCSPRMLESI